MAKHCIAAMLFVICTLPGALSWCFAGELPRAAILRIETNAHTSQITSMAVSMPTDATNGSRFVVTGSIDKTARVWEMIESNGSYTVKEPIVLRPPIGSGAEGKIFAVAISPDGSTIACGGWTMAGDDTYNVYLFNRKDGKLFKKLAGLPSIITNMAFSNGEGRYFGVVYGGNKKGIRMYRTDDYVQIAEDATYKKRITDIDMKESKVITASEDGIVRLYDLDPSKIRKNKDGSNIPNSQYEHSAFVPTSVMFDENAATIAAAFISVPSGKIITSCNQTGHEKTIIEILSQSDEQTLKPSESYQFRTDQIHQCLNILSWTKDKRLTALEQNSNFKFNKMQTWEVISNSPIAVDAPVSTMLTGGETIENALSLDRDHVITRNKIRIGLWTTSPNSIQIIDYKTPKLLLFEKGSSVIISKDGETVKFDGRIFSIPTLTFHNDNAVPLLYGVDIQTTTEGDCDKGIRLKNIPIIENPQESCLSVAGFNKEMTVVGTLWNLRLYDNERELSKIAIPAPAYSVNIARNGRKIVAALGDGTIRWYSIVNKKEMRELLAFTLLDHNNWVLWTPSGHFRVDSDTTLKYVGYHSQTSQDNILSVNFITAHVNGDLFSKYQRKYRDNEQADEKSVIKQVLNYNDDIEAIYQVNYKKEKRHVCQNGRVNYRISPWYPSRSTNQYFYKQGEALLKSVQTLTSDPTYSRRYTEVASNLSNYLTSSLTDTAGDQQSLLSFENKKKFTQSKDGTSFTIANTSTGARGSWDTELILGVKDFVMERAESELVSWYLDKLLSQICASDKSTNSSSAYFYNLCTLKKDYQTSQTLSQVALLTAFKKDLEYVPVDLLCHLIDDEEEQILAYVVIGILKEISRGGSPAHVIAGLAENEAIVAACAGNVSAIEISSMCGLYFAGVATQAYLGVTQSRKNEKIYWNDYLILLYSKIYKDLKSKDGNLAKKYLVFIVANIDILKQYLTELDSLFNDIQAQLEELKSLTRHETKNALHEVSAPALQVSRDVVSILSKYYRLVEAKGLNENHLEPVLNSAAFIASGLYFDAAQQIRSIIKRNSRDFCADINENVFGDLDCESSPLSLKKQLNDKYENVRILNERCESKCKPLFPFADVRNDESQPQEFNVVLSNETSNEYECKISCQLQFGDTLRKCAVYLDSKQYERLNKISPIYEHLPKVADIAAARNQDDVKRILNNVASPIGAWRMKLEKDRLTSVGALVGPQFSYETLRGADNGFATGLFAPLGLDWSWYWPSQNYYYGLFFSVADFGNLTSTRIHSIDKVDNNADLGWSQLLSPGVYLHSSLAKKSPLMIGLGASYPPLLRAVRTDDGVREERGGLRYMLFIAIDVTLWPLNIF